MRPKVLQLAVRIYGGLESSGFLSVRIISRKVMKDLNLKFRGMRTPTNILTFSKLGDCDPINQNSGLCLGIMKLESSKKKESILNCSLCLKLRNSGNTAAPNSKSEC
ncbi:rRNA maturation factor [Candidatus Tremblaya phenacola PAVE]|nr:rRNA maturation factor [Candidatus Tremblaya phenacola PAVE]